MSSLKLVSQQQGCAAASPSKLSLVFDRWSNKPQSGSFTSTDEWIIQKCLAIDMLVTEPNNTLVAIRKKQQQQQKNPKCGPVKKPGDQTTEQEASRVRNVQ